MGPFCFCLKMGQHRLLFCSFSFASLHLTDKTALFSRSQTRIDRVEGEHANYYGSRKRVYDRGWKRKEPKLSLLTICLSQLVQFKDKNKGCQYSKMFSLFLVDLKIKK